MSRRIEWHSFLPSTMTEAARLADAGAPSGTVIGADVQTAGQGRHGRHWESQVGGLYISVILRAPLGPEELPVLTLALGLAVAESLQQSAGIACDLRWPNDVLINGRKCAGILTQLHDDVVIAGIGINVAQASFPPELEALATSILLAAGKAPSRDVLLNALLDSIDSHTALLQREGKDRILDMFTQASSFVTGRRVIVDQGGYSDEGVTEGLNSNGFLVLRTPAGQRKVILAGGVRPAP